VEDIVVEERAKRIEDLGEYYKGFFFWEEFLLLD